MDKSIIERYISEGVDKAKAGDANAVYAAIADGIEFADIPTKSHYGLGWIIYYALHQSPDKEIVERKKMLVYYLNLRLTKPHKLHSMILTEAVRLYKDTRNAAYGKRKDDIDTFSIVKFCKLWDLKNLRPGDWRRKELDGKPLTSTAEKLLTVLSDEMEGLKLTPEAEIVSFANELIALYPDSFNLYYQRAVMYLSEGEKEKAIEMLKKGILLAPGKFFLWSKLGQLVDADRHPRLRVSLLNRAMISPGPEQFKGRIRLMLAKIFADINAYPQAKWELEHVKRIYEANGWHLSPAYKAIERSIPEGTIPGDPTPAYKSVEKLADDFIYSALPVVEMKKTYHKLPDTNKTFRNTKPAIAWRITNEEGTNIWFTPERHGIDPNLQMGTIVKVKIYNGKIVKAEI